MKGESGWIGAGTNTQSKRKGFSSLQLNRQWSAARIVDRRGKCSRLFIKKRHVHDQSTTKKPKKRSSGYPKRQPSWPSAFSHFFFCSCFLLSSMEFLSCYFNLSVHTTLSSALEGRWHNVPNLPACLLTFFVRCGASEEFCMLLMRPTFALACLCCSSCNLV